MTLAISGTTGITLATQFDSASSFGGTALLVMEHNKTGLKYFCKTSRLQNLRYYRGSGHYWKRHLKTHGKDISIGVLGIYFDETRCIAAAKEFSKLHNVAKNPEWANLIAENGLDGAPVGANHPMYGKPSPSKGQKRPWVGKSGASNPMYGKVSPMRGVAKPKGIHSPLYGRKRPEGGGKKPHPVIGIDANGIETMYGSVAEAAKAIEGSRSGINKCCTGKAKTAHGHKWRYAKEVV
jgi:hypothetical protein